MFKVKTHDFGTVAAGTENVYEFEFQNLYKEPVHIQSVRSSCGCTSVSIKNQTLKSWDKGAIVSKFNTDKFRGNRRATITVVIDKPYPAEVQLLVQGNIRGDISFSPGSISFDEVKLPSDKTRTIRVTKYGNINWKIEDVRSTFKHLAVRLQLVHRRRDSVAYDMHIKMKDTAPAGYVETELIIMADDGMRTSTQYGSNYNNRYRTRVSTNNSLKPIPIALSGKVVASKKANTGEFVSAIQMSPNVVAIGPLKPGASSTKKVLIKCDQPFAIDDVKCTNSCFQVKAGDGTKKLHFLEVTYIAGEETGEFRDNLIISTSHEAKPIELPTVVKIAK
jgi:hypothetical protein